MAITERTTATAVQQSAASSPTAVSFPTDLAVGDLMILECWTGGTASNTVSTPAGWTSIAQLAGTANTAAPNAAAYRRVATSGDVSAGSVSVTHGAVLLSANVYGYAGFDTSSPMDFTATTFDQTTAGTGAGPASATVATDGTCLLLLVSGVSTSATCTPPAGFTELQDRTVASSRAGEVSRKFSQAAGATGSISATWSTSIKSVGILIGIRPLTMSGTLASTLAGATLAASGTVTNAVTGTLAVTLGATTLAASGTETFTGTLAATLGDATFAGSGTVANPVTGTLASTLAGATLAGAGTETITGSLSVTLAGATLAGSGAETITGTLATTLGGASLAASGTVANPVTGTLAATTAGATLAASGTSGPADVTGILAATLAGATLAATGAEAFQGTFAATLGGATLSGAGTVANPAAGTITVTLDGATLSAFGVETVQGSLTVSLDDLALDAAGTSILNATGTLDVTLAGAVLSAAGFTSGVDDGVPVEDARLALTIVAAALHLDSPATWLELTNDPSILTLEDA